MSVYDELAKLADLEDRGVLTNEEFESMKAKLLAGTRSDAPSEPEIDPRVELIEALELTQRKFHLPASDPPTLANTYLEAPADNEHKEGWYIHSGSLDPGGLLWWTGNAWVTDWKPTNVFQGVPLNNGLREGWYPTPSRSGLRWWDGNHWSDTTNEGDG